MEIDFTPGPTPTDGWREVHSDSAAVVLFLHGITGSPAAWSPVARAIAARGVSVSVPLLPGHGTSWQDLNRSSWSQWLASAVSELRTLQSEHDRVIVAGLSMGGALTVSLAALPRGPEEIVLVNPALYVDSPLAPLLPVLKHVVRSVPAIGGDIAHPGRDEFAYSRTPVAAIASFSSALRQLRQDLWKVECAVTVFVSGRDNVVGPRTLSLLRSDLPWTPRIVALRRSRHVATLDWDAATIAEALVDIATNASGDASARE